MPILEHPALSRSIPMAVTGSSFHPAGSAEAYFRGLESLGFTCEAEDMTRWRVRRVKVACIRANESLLYEGGFPPDRGSVIFDRVSQQGVLLGGRELAAHVRGVSTAAVGPREPRVEALAAATR
jgi:hypothetical protein